MNERTKQPTNQRTMDKPRQLDLEWSRVCEEKGDEQAAASSYHEWIKTAEAADSRTTLDGGGRTQGREERRGGEDVRASVRACVCWRTLVSAASGCQVWVWVRVWVSEQETGVGGW